ncbi:MAG: HAMP domain-containing protein [Fibrobacter sp.]|nr:HAMP domain-containing protein [Fibrobacter sp.]
MITISAFFLLISGFITVLLTSKIINPIHSVVSSVTALGNGDLTCSCPVMSEDETADIANALNQTMKSMSQMVQKIKELSGVITHKIIEFTETADNISQNTLMASQKTSQSAASATSATTSLNEVSSSTETMSTSIDNIAGAIEEMSSSLNEVAKNCQVELSIATEASKQAQDALTQMENLKNTNNKVSVVLDVITSISKSTNLLALNATIEAASAGSAGRGFAVVANEVKELSLQTKKSVEEIQKLVNEISLSSNSAVSAVSKIAKVIDEINTISQTIVSAIEEQSATINEISKNMTQSNISAKSIAQHVKLSASDISHITGLIVDVDKTASETASGISEIKNSTESLSKIASDLNKTVEHFKL